MPCPPSIFVSYPSVTNAGDPLANREEEERGWVTLLVERLRLRILPRVGRPDEVRFNIDYQDFRSDQRLTDQIARFIDDADIFLVVACNAYFASQWCPVELDRAARRRMPHIYVLLLHPMDKEELDQFDQFPMPLKDLKRLDFYEQRSDDPSRDLGSTLKPGDREYDGLLGRLSREMADVLKPLVRTCRTQAPAVPRPILPVFPPPDKGDPPPDGGISPSDGEPPAPVGGSPQPANDPPALAAVPDAPGASVNSAVLTAQDTGASAEPRAESNVQLPEEGPVVILSTVPPGGTLPQRRFELEQYLTDAGVHVTRIEQIRVKPERFRSTMESLLADPRAVFVQLLDNQEGTPVPGMQETTWVRLQAEAAEQCGERVVKWSEEAPADGISAAHRALLEAPCVWSRSAAVQSQIPFPEFRKAVWKLAVKHATAKSAPAPAPAREVLVNFLPQDMAVAVQVCDGIGRACEREPILASSTQAAGRFTEQLSCASHVVLVCVSATASWASARLEYIRKHVPPECRLAVYLPAATAAGATIRAAVKGVIFLTAPDGDGPLQEELASFLTTSRP